MHDAVAATGREIEKLDAEKAARRGCVSTLMHQARTGRLSRKEKQKLSLTSARFGQLEALKWWRQNGCKLKTDTCMSAASGGHLEVLHWLRVNGCPWDEWTCGMAACGGHLEVLRWARENGCPWDEKTCRYAAMGEHIEVLQWAIANGRPNNDDIDFGWDVISTATDDEF
jgi:hypothetical protein